MSGSETPMRQQVRTALRALARASAPRPASARRAAKSFGRPFFPAVCSEIRWAFHPPFTWLSGLLANLVMAAVWLVVQPLTFEYGGHQLGRHFHFHHAQLDWVVLVSTYFSSFVLADVTTTNLLGSDHYRVAQGLADGVPLWRMLLLKNLALMAIVGLPTLAVAAVLTVWREGVPQLAMTIPNVSVPIVSWLGVGNVISVLHPVPAEPLLRRWRQRRNLRRTAGWVLAVTLPYALYYVADPMGGVEHRILWTQIPAAIGPVFGRDTKSFLHLGTAVLVWIGGTMLAILLARRRGVRFR